MHSLVVIVPIRIARIREDFAQIRFYVEREIEKWIRVMAVGNVERNDQAGVICPLCPLPLAWLRRGGLTIVPGILSEQREGGIMPKPNPRKGEVPMPKVNRTSVAVGFALSAAGLMVFSSWPAEAQQSRSERSYYYSQRTPSGKVARQQNSQQGNSVYWNGCCGPASIKMGTDPDPNIRSQLAREATRFFGGGEP